MKNIVNFLERLAKNNNRDWFDQHRGEYQSVREEFTLIAESLITSLGRFDTTIASLQPKDCLYRINRDTRFSPNKDPYKTYMSAFFCPGGKKSGYAGYYLHIEAPSGKFLGGHLLATGIYNPDKDVLASIREEIIDQYDSFQRSIDNASGFYLDKEGALKRVPNGYDKNAPYAELLKLKNFSLDRLLDDEFINSPDFVQKAAAEYEKTYQFKTILNRATQYAFEQR